MRLRDVNVGWYHCYGLRVDAIRFFCNFYNSAIAVYTSRFSTMAAGTPVRDAARALLQTLYRDIPFAEMKKEGNDFFVRPPA